MRRNEHVTQWWLPFWAAVVLTVLVSASLDGFAHRYMAERPQPPQRFTVWWAHLWIERNLSPGAVRLRATALMDQIYYW